MTDFIVIICTIVAAAAGIIGIRMEHSGSRKDEKKEKK